MVIGGPGHPQTEVVGQGPGSLAIGEVVASPASAMAAKTESGTRRRCRRAARGCAAMGTPPALRTSSHALTGSSAQWRT